MKGVFRLVGRGVRVEVRVGMVGMGLGVGVLAVRRGGGCWGIGGMIVRGLVLMLFLVVDGVEVCRVLVFEYVASLSLSD